jgi:hypothetical protein
MDRDMAKIKELTEIKVNDQPSFRLKKLGLMLQSKSAALEKLGSRLKEICDQRTDVENLIKEELTHIKETDYIKQMEETSVMMDILLGALQNMVDDNGLFIDKVIWMPDMLHKEADDVGWPINLDDYLGDII